ncbi:MAG: hypothetical protein H6748_10895 [Spirochaetaceae bacterium]|nr:hypothetical protein [Spirochaetaceae bacterium]HPG27835.1 hypothetical protein [Myxococcota bacterium]
MAELEWEDEPDRASLRRAVRHRLRRDEPALRVVAEGFLAEASPIDLLAVGAEGELVSIRLADRDEEAVALTRLLSDLAWLRPRLEDLLKLAPGLGLEPSAEPRGVLVAPDFGAETRLAVENLPGHTISLIGYRCLRWRGQATVFLEPVKHAGGRVPLERPGTARRAPAGRTPAADPRDGRRPSRLLADPPSSSAFRTGLTDADLRDEAPLGEPAAIG